MKRHPWSEEVLEKLTDEDGNPAPVDKVRVHAQARVHAHAHTSALARTGCELEPRVSSYMQILVVDPTTYLHAHALTHAGWQPVAAGQGWQAHPHAVSVEAARACDVASR